MSDDRITGKDKAWFVLALLGFAAMCAIYLVKYGSSL
jgi:hypothetical protein